MALTVAGCAAKVVAPAVPSAPRHPELLPLHLPAGTAPQDAALIEQGRAAMIGPELNCIDCHLFRGEGGGKGPDLTGWASRDWTIDFLHNPAHKRFYGRRNDRMPASGERGELSRQQLEMLADWLRGAVY